MKKLVYLAGPEVFTPNAIEIGQAKKDLCKKYNFIGLFPLDNDIDLGPNPGIEEATKIYEGNLGYMHRCDLCIANITPFRGSEPDSGTCFEIGFLVANAKPVYTYSNSTAVSYQQKIAHHFGLDKSNSMLDKDGYEIEPFGGYSNLMIDIPTMMVGTHTQVGKHIFDLEGFEACLKAAARDFH